MTEKSRSFHTVLPIKAITGGLHRRRLSAICTANWNSLKCISVLQWAVKCKCHKCLLQCLSLNSGRMHKFCRTLAKFKTDSLVSLQVVYGDKALTKIHCTLFKQTDSKMIERH